VRRLESASARPEASAGGRGRSRGHAINITGLLGDVVSASVHARGATREEHEEEGEEEDDGGGEDGPCADGEEGVAAAAVLVDVVPDNGEQGEINGHDDEGEDEGDGSDTGSEEGAAET